MRGRIDGVVHAHENAGVRGNHDVFALARDDIDRAARQSDAESANNMAEDGANQRGTAGADGRGEHVTFVIVFFLHDSAFVHLHILAGLVVGNVAGLLNGDDAHLHGDDAAVRFRENAETEIHVRLSANKREVARRSNRADDAVNAGAGGNQKLIAEIDGLSRRQRRTDRRPCEAEVLTEFNRVR